jgi:DNA-binding NarL/FixJ family response regulator
MSIRVALVEDDPLYRESLATILRGTPGFTCASTHPSAEDALANLHPKRTDVALVDISLPGQSGIELVRQLAQQAPKLLPVMLTIYDDPDRLFEALTAGARGYVLKSTPPAGILEAIREAHDGGAPMSRGVARKVLQFFRRHSKADAPARANGVPDKLRLDLLTERELEIVRSIEVGFLAKEIADRLGITHGTVRKHLQNIYRKLEVCSRKEAAERLRSH